jgi:tRNA threonylcarbamoyladenosine biosynthesis protein TsaB
MKILALDSSGLVASVAVVENDTLLAEYTVNYKKTHSQTLLPMIDEMVKMTEKHSTNTHCIKWIASTPS